MSTGDEASRFARFAFRRHFFQHLGFRIAQSVVDQPPVRLVETPVFVLGVGVEGKFFFFRFLFSSGSFACIAERASEWMVYCIKKVSPKLSKLFVLRLNLP